jgi:putative glutamine amidotransferase
LVETGWSVLDELPEAIEAPGRRFALGVQWHPEVDPDSRLIEALVAEAAAARNGAGR